MSSLAGRRTWWVWAREQVLLTVDDQGRVTLWNNGAERAFGVQAERATGQPLGEVLTAPSGKALAEAVDKVVGGGGHAEVRDASFRNEDIVRYFDFRCSAFTAQDGQPPHVLVVGTDVTSRHGDDPMLRQLDKGRDHAVGVFEDEVPQDRRDREETVPEPEPAAARGSLSFLGDCAFVCDEDHRVVFWTRSTAALFGISEDDARGRGVFELLPFLDNRKVRQAVRQALQGLPGVVPQVMRPSNPVPLRVVASPAGDLADGSRGYVVVVTEERSWPPDLSQPMTLAALEDRFHGLTREASEPMLLLTTTGEVLDANPAARSFFGLARKALPPLRQLLVASRDRPFPGLEGIGLESARMVEDVHVRSPKGKRSCTMLVWAVTPGIPSTLVAMFLDTTERDRHVQQVMETRDLLTVYNRILTHDISNLLTSMYMRLRLADDVPGMPEGARRQVAAVHGLAKEVEALIHNIQILHTAPAGGKPPLLDATETLQEAFSMAALAFPGKELRPPSSGEEVWVRAEPTLAQVFYNIISNAIRHNPREGAWVGVQAAPARLGRAEAIAWSIIDNGPGVPKEHRTPKRLQDCNTRRGLGLAIANALVRRWGGTLDIQDRLPGKPDQGTAVRITLPVARRPKGVNKGALTLPPALPAKQPAPKPKAARKPAAPRRGSSGNGARNPPKARRGSRPAGRRRG